MNKIITVVPFLCVLLFCQASLADNAKVEIIYLAGKKMEMRRHLDAGWAGVDYYVCLDESCPGKNICDTKMACLVGGTPQKVTLGDLTEEECLSVANEYMSDMQRFCRDFFSDNLKTSPYDEGDEAPKASFASQ